jgi:hypothetical protein
VKRFARSLALVLLAVPAAAHAQQPRVPTVTITTTEAKSTEQFSSMVSVRGLSDGSAIVADATLATRRLVLLDKSLAHAKVILDSAAMTLGVNGLIPFAGDSTIIVEVSSQSMLVLDASGKVARVMAPPKGQDIFLLSGMNTATGTAGIDPLGRIVYRANYRMMPAPNAQGQMMMPPPPEKAPIVRGNFDTRTVDTIGELAIPVMIRQAPRPMGVAMTDMKVEVNPMATGDEWAMLSDGSIAIVRWQDYHIDWIDADGTKRSGPKMLFDWRKASDDEKKFKVDSMTKWIDSMIKLEAARPLPPGMPNMVRPPQPTFSFIPLDQMPTYHPPIRPGSVRADRDNNLWILPTTSSDAKNGLLYDVVNRKGELYQRVQLPPGAVIAGFGKGGLVYLLQQAGDKWSLSRARVSFGGT